MVNKISSYLFTLIILMLGFAFLFTLYNGNNMGYGKAYKTPLTETRQELVQPTSTNTVALSKRTSYVAGIAEVKESGINYYAKDHLGSYSLITDNYGNAISEFASFPFGETKIDSSNERKYTGKELDDTGLYYYGARFYSPGIGRFTQVDPLLRVKSNYVYASNNPLIVNDPTGMADTKYFYMRVPGTQLLQAFENGGGIVGPSLPRMVDPIDEILFSLSYEHRMPFASGSVVQVSDNLEHVLMFTHKSDGIVAFKPEDVSGSLYGPRALSAEADLALRTGTTGIDEDALQYLKNKIPEANMHFVTPSKGTERFVINNFDVVVPPQKLSAKAAARLSKYLPLVGVGAGIADAALQYKRGTFGGVVRGTAACAGIICDPVDWIVGLYDITQMPDVQSVQTPTYNANGFEYGISPSEGTSSQSEKFKYKLE